MALHAQHGVASSKQIVAGYEIGSMIGIGTYGEVRVAKQVATGQRVAVKIVDLSRFDRDASTIMLKEIDILKNINHPNCIRIIEVHDQVSYSGTWCSGCACTEYKPMLGSGECLNCAPHDGADHCLEETRQVMLLVQELAVGGELFGLLMHNGPFPEDIARFYFQQLVEGLSYCHTRGIVHRDLKPENLVLDGNFQLKIVDFGLASHALDESVVMHSGVGSAPYSAPEVFYSKELFHNRGYKGQAADIWSCAVILFVMLTGRPPFLRPLARTYGPNLKRCKHFVNILRGQGYGSMSTQARTFLMKLFQLDPAERPTMSQIKTDEWYQGPVPSLDILGRIMEEKAHAVWMSQQKPQMIELLSKHRSDLRHTPVLTGLPVIHGNSHGHHHRDPRDPFANANVDMSLLSLEEQESTSVYRSIEFGALPSFSDFSDVLDRNPFGKALSVRDDGEDEEDIFDVVEECEDEVLQTHEDDEEALEDDEGEHVGDEVEFKQDLTSGSSYCLPSRDRDGEDNTSRRRMMRAFPSPGSPCESSRSLSRKSSASPGSLFAQLPKEESTGISHFTQMLSSLSLEEIKSRLCHRLRVLGLTSAVDNINNLMLVRGTFNGSPLCGTISFADAPASTTHSPSVVVDFQKIRGDMLNFHQFFRFASCSLS